MSPSRADRRSPRHTEAAIAGKARGVVLSGDGSSETVALRAGPHNERDTQPMNRLRLGIVLAVAIGSAGLVTIRVSASGSGLRPANACPILVNREARTPSTLLKDFGRQVRALFNSPEGAYRRYSVQAVVSLSTTRPGPPGVRLAHYERVASAACGADTAHRSWVVVAWFPNSRAATVAQEAYWLAPTRSGWQVWWAWNPRPGWDKTGAFPGR